MTTESKQVHRSIFHRRAQRPTSDQLQAMATDPLGGYGEREQTLVLDRIMADAEAGPSVEQLRGQAEFFDAEDAFSH